MRATYTTFCLVHFKGFSVWKTCNSQCTTQSLSTRHFRIKIDGPRADFLPKAVVVTEKHVPPAAKAILAR